MASSMRKARRADLDVIVQMLANDVLGSTREDATMPAAVCYQKAFAAIDKDPNQYLTVAERNGAVVGCLQLSFVPGLSRKGMWRGQIESVRTLSSERGQGIGGEMLRWAIEKCREHGCGLVQLTTDKSRPEALRFYEAAGFAPSHIGMKLDIQ